nr:sialate O-acetylesterase [Pedobacter xinjiangensis]
MMGQSNMAGRGQLNDEFLQKKHPRVKVLTAEMTWKIAQHPLHFDKPKLAGVGPGLSFGQVLAEAYPRDTIALVPCAVGGTSIAKWEKGAYDKNTDTQPYKDAVRRIRAARKSGEIAGVIWLQGEADSREDRAKVYNEKLLNFIKNIRREVQDPALPFVLGEIGHFRSRYDLINKELRKVPSLDANVSLVTAENLNHKGDTTHFDSNSAEQYGIRFGNKMVEMLNRN